MRSYPRIGNKQRAGKRCKLCPELAGYRVEIQTNYMRGDDLVYYLCPEHAEWDAQRLVRAVKEQVAA